MTAWVRRITHAGPRGVPTRSPMTAWVRRILAPHRRRAAFAARRTPTYATRTSALLPKRLGTFDAPRGHPSHAKGLGCGNGRPRRATAAPAGQRHPPPRIGTHRHASAAVAHHPARVPAMPSRLEPGGADAAHSGPRGPAGEATSPGRPPPRHRAQPRNSATELSHGTQPRNSATELSHGTQPRNSATVLSHGAQPRNSATELSRAAPPGAAATTPRPAHPGGRQAAHPR